MSSNNTKENKDLVCCKSCDGKGYNKKHIKINIPCKKCCGTGNIPWIDNLVKRNKDGDFSYDQRNELYFNILLLIDTLEDLCKTADYELKVQVHEDAYRGNILGNIENKVKEVMPYEYLKMKGRLK